MFLGGFCKFQFLHYQNAFASWNFVQVFDFPHEYLINCFPVLSMEYCPRWVAVSFVKQRLPKILKICRNFKTINKSIVEFLVYDINNFLVTSYHMVVCFLVYEYPVSLPLHHHHQKEEKKRKKNKRKGKGASLSLLVFGITL